MTDVESNRAAAWVRDDESGAPLAGRAASAFAWRLLSESLKLALQLAVTVILARLLPVEAFGLLTLAMIVINLGSRISQLGLAPAVIQRRELTEAHVRTAFTLSVVGGLTLSALVWALADAAAALFRADAVASLLRLVSAWFLFTGAGATAEALAQRRLDYRRLLFVELTSYCAGFAAVSIGLALAGFGAWALAWGLVAQSALKAALALAACPHPMKPSFARAEAGDLLGYGVGTGLSSVANFAAVNGDYFVVGRWLGPSALGLYSRAYTLVSMPMYQFSSVISSVLFPVYSRMQGDTARLRRSYLFSVFAASLFVAPSLAVLALAAPEIMAGVFGPDWAPATVPLQVLCLGGMFHAMYNLGDSVIRAAGAVYLKFWCHAVYAACVVAGSVVGSRWGIAGVAAGVVCALTVVYVLIGQLSIHLTKASWREYLASQLPGAALAAGTAGAALPVAGVLRAAGLPPLAILVMTLSAAGVAFAAAALALARWWPGLDRYVTREEVKSLLSGNERLLKAAEVVYENATYVPHIARRRLWRAAAGLRRGRGGAPRQTPTTWDVALPDVGSAQELVAWLRARGLTVMEGGHTFYLPPQPGLASVIPGVAEFYPPGSGFKVLKDFRPPAEARYLFKHRRTMIFLRTLIGTPRDQLRAAATLSLLGLGPRVWDLACWRAHGRRFTVFVVEHVGGVRPTAGQCASFLERLGEADGAGPVRILVPDWRRREDFLPPDCNKNLVYSAELGRALYVDFQNFGALGAPGAEAPRGGGPLAKALAPRAVALEGRVVLAVGCGRGDVVREALALGAGWVLGWDRPEVVAAAELALLSAGETRFTLFGADLASGVRLEEDIPRRLRARLPDAVVAYDAGRAGPSALASVGRAAWQVLVYQPGAEGDDAALADLLRDLRAAGRRVAASGPGGAAGGPGPVVVCAAPEAPAASPAPWPPAMAAAGPARS